MILVLAAICHWLSDQFTALADWLDPPVPVILPLPTPASPPPDVVILTVQRDMLYRRACELVQAVAVRDPLASGENKQHQVRARLYKDFPEVSGRAVSLAIEAAVGGPSA